MAKKTKKPEFGGVANLASIVIEANADKFVADVSRYMDGFNPLDLATYQNTKNFGLWLAEQGWRKLGGDK